MSGTYFVIVVLLLPETQRKIVANGSIPTTGTHRSLFDWFIQDRRELKKTDSENGHPQRKVSKADKRKCHIPNPFKCLPMLFSKGNFTVILIGSITYTVKMTLQASLAAQCIDIYKLNYLQAGLIYLPSGVGGAIASYSTGKLLDRNIKRFSAKYRPEGGQYHRGDEISNFPIEQARLAGMYTLVAISAVGTAAYGVSLNEEAHLAVPLGLQFLTGATTSSIFTICGTLLTDLNPHASATVQASYNLVRCIGAGAAIAAQQPLADAAGSGWCFGVFSIIMLCALPLAVVVKICGLGWRREEASGFGSEQVQQTAVAAAPLGDPWVLPVVAKMQYCTSRHCLVKLDNNDDVARATTAFYG